MGRTRGRGPFKEDWISLCSAHRRYREDCELCNAGHWSNHWMAAFGHLFWVISPDLWRKLANSWWGQWLVLPPYWRKRPPWRKPTKNEHT